MGASGLVMRDGSLVEKYGSAVGTFCIYHGQIWEFLIQP